MWPISVNTSNNSNPARSFRSRCDRDVERHFPRLGSTAMAIAIMISTFGCVNSLVLAGPRVYYAMACDGLFFSQIATLNRARVPGRSLLIQCVWSAALVLPRTFNVTTGQYGNLYSNLLDYVISAALIFYIATIAGVIRLRHQRPHAERPYRTPGYPVVPVLYVLGASTVLLILLFIGQQPPGQDY